MGFLDWFTQPTCEELNPLAMALRDPVAFVLTPNADVIQVGFPDPPNRLAISRAVLMTPAEVQAATRLLTVYYKHPTSGLHCLWTAGWISPAGRARAFVGIAEYGKLRGFDALTVPAVTEVLLKVFEDPAASRGAASPENGVVYAAAQVVLEARTPTLDAATWLPLWRWALGGPNGAAAVRTRVMAMKALQAILRRDSLRLAQLKAAGPMADVLRGLVEARAPSIANVAERNLFISDATAVVGEVIQAVQRAEAAAGLVPGWQPSPARSKAGWWVAAGAALVAVGAAVYHHRRA